MTVHALTVSYQQAQDGLHTIARRRREARAELEAAHHALAQAEGEYRVARAEAFDTVDAPTAAHREAKVDAAVAPYRAARDIAKGRIDTAREAINEIDGERASLHRLIEWSLRLDPTALVGGMKNAV